MLACLYESPGRAVALTQATRLSKISMLSSAEHKIFLLINVGILTFYMSRENSIVGLKKTEFLYTFVLMSI